MRFCAVSPAGHHALMNLQMPDISGIEAIIAIRGEFPDVRIIVLTTYAGDVQMVRALKAGARGYLLKGNVHTRATRSRQAKPSVAPQASRQPTDPCAVTRR